MIVIGPARHALIPLESEEATVDLEAAVVEDRGEATEMVASVKSEDAMKAVVPVKALEDAEAPLVANDVGPSRVATADRRAAQVRQALDAQNVVEAEAMVHLRSLHLRAVADVHLPAAPVLGHDLHERHGAREADHKPVREGNRLAASAPVRLPNTAAGATADRDVTEDYLALPPKQQQARVHHPLRTRARTRGPHRQRALLGVCITFKGSAPAEARVTTATMSILSPRQQRSASKDSRPREPKPQPKPLLRRRPLLRQ